MRILFVARNIPVPGIDENDIILRVARRLIDRGARVEVVFPVEWLPIPGVFLRGRARALGALPDELEVQGVRIVVWRYLRLPGEGLSYLLAALRLGGGRVSFDPDIVHAHYVLPDGEIARKIATRSKKPFIVTVRQGDWRKLSTRSTRSPLRLLAARVLRCAAEVFSPSKVIADRLAGWGLRVSVMPHAVDSSPAGAGLKPVTGPLVVTVAARLSVGKQVDWVLQGVADLGTTRPVELRVIGDGPEGSKLRAAASELSVNARFIGQVPREVVLRNLQESHVFALPSASETFGIAYLEAAASGCAVIATRGTGVDGLFEDGAEMLFQDGRYEDFLRCLRTLVEDDVRRTSIARLGRERVLKDYLWDAVTRRYTDAYMHAARVGATSNG